MLVYDVGFNDKDVLTLIIKTNSINNTIKKTNAAIIFPTTVNIDFMFCLSER